MATFTPRQVYPHLSSIPRSYFLGHHAAGLSKMKALLGSTDLIIECRDYRTPIVSRNPLFEEALGERPRLIVYTRQDLGSKNSTADKKVCSFLHAGIQANLSSESKSFRNGMLLLLPCLPAQCLPPQSERSSTTAKITTRPLTLCLVRES